MDKIVFTLILYTKNSNSLQIELPNTRRENIEIENIPSDIVIEF
jgi:hypothetical protein